MSAHPSYQLPVAAPIAIFGVMLVTHIAGNDAFIPFFLQAVLLPITLWLMVVGGMSLFFCLVFTNSMLIFLWDRCQRLAAYIY